MCFTRSGQRPVPGGKKGPREGKKGWREKERKRGVRKGERRRRHDPSNTLALPPPFSLSTIPLDECISSSADAKGALLNSQDPRKGCDRVLRNVRSRSSHFVKTFCTRVLSEAVFESER